MNLSHRLRLALVASSVTGLVLGTLFVVIVLFAREDVLSDKQMELTSAMRSFTPPGDPKFDFEEFQGAHPELSAATYDADGSLAGATGRFRPERRQGFVVRQGWLQYGKPFKGQDIVIALDLHEAERGLERLRLALGAILLPLALLVGGTTWLAAQSVFRPLSRLSAQALAMGGTDLSERLGTSDRAEFGAFADRLNQMLDRIEETVRRGERFSADAAHELRTPLAILRTRLETALLQTRSADQYEATIRRSLAEIDRVTAITEALLRSSRGVLPPASPTDLEPIAMEAAARWAQRFDLGGVRLEAATTALCAEILPEEIRIVLDNLLDNALRYAPRGSTVRLALADEDGEAMISVRDAGSGIPVELGERVFDRFVRADDSRNRASGGAGIGLSVCRQIVASRGGRMGLGDPPNGGAEVFCLLPGSGVASPT